MTKISKSGYKRNSKDKKEKSLIIPSSNITMKNVDFPVFGVDNLGNTQMMYPGIDYTFPGEYVYEVPMARYGGDPSIPDLSEGWLNKYQTAGQVEGPKVIQSGNGFEYGYSGDNVMMRPIGQKEWTTIPADKVAAVKNLMPGLDFDVNKLTPDFQAWKKQAYAELEQKNQEEIKAKRAETIQRNKFKTNPGSEKVLPPPVSITNRYPGMVTPEEVLPSPVPITNRYPGMVTPPSSGPLKEKPYLGPDPIKAPSGFTFEDPAKKKLVKGNTKDRVITYNQEYKDFVYSKGDGTYDPSNPIPFFKKPEFEPESESDEVDYWAGLKRLFNKEFTEEDPEAIFKDSDKIETLPQDDTKYGYTPLYTRADKYSSNSLDSLQAFTNVFDNTVGAKYYVGHKEKELQKGAKSRFENSAAVAHFLRDADILPGQQYAPEEWNVAGKGAKMRSTSKGKAISATGLDDPNKYRMMYKKNEDDSYTIKYEKLKDITPENSKGWEYDLAVSGQHRYSDIDWDGEGDKTGFKIFNNSTRWVPLKPNAKKLKGWTDDDTRIPYKDKDGFSRFSGGSLVYIFKDPKTGKTIGIDAAGSINTLKKVGQDIIEKYNISGDDIDVVYHDMGSYSAKPAAQNGVIDYKQWLDYNSQNRGFSGAPLIIPSKKDGGWLHKYQNGGTADQDGSEVTYVTDPNDPRLKDYQTRLNLYNYSQIPNWWVKKDVDVINEILSGNYNTQEDIDSYRDYDPFSYSQRTTNELVGPYGSQAIKLDIPKNKLESFINDSRLVTSGYLAYPWGLSTGEEILANYPPDGYQGMITYTSYPYTARTAVNPNEKYRSNNLWTLPKTQFLEDVIDRKALKQVYPLLKDEEIDAVVSDMRESPGYMTNVWNPEIGEYFQPWVKDAANLGDYFDPKTDTSVPVVNGLYPKTILGKINDGARTAKAYLNEDIIDRIYQSGMYMPMWNKPTNPVYYKKPYREANFSSPMNIVTVGEEGKSALRSYSKLAQDRYPGLSTDDYVHHVQIGDKPYPVSYSNDRTHGEVTIDNKPYQLQFVKDPNTGRYEAKLVDGFSSALFKTGGGLQKYQTTGEVNSELAKYMKQPMDPNDLRYVGNQEAVADNTRVVVPQVQRTEKQAPAIKQEAQRQKVEETKQGNIDQWGRPYDNEWYGFDPSTKQFTVEDPWGRAPDNDWYGFDPDMKDWVKGTNSRKQTPPYGYVRKSVPGGHGSMMTIWVDPKTLDKWIHPEEIAEQQAFNEIASSNNIDPIGLGILMASGAGPAVRTAAAAMPWLNAPAVLPYIGEVPWLTATNVLGAYGAAHSTQQILDPSSELRTNPNAENILMTGLGYLGLGIGKTAMEGSKQLGKSMFNTPKLLPISPKSINPKKLGSSDILASRILSGPVNHLEGLIAGTRELLFDPQKLNRSFSEVFPLSKAAQTKAQLESKLANEAANEFVKNYIYRDSDVYPGIKFIREDVDDKILNIMYDGKNPTNQFPNYSYYSDIVPSNFGFGITKSDNPLMYVPNITVNTRYKNLKNNTTLNQGDLERILKNRATTLGVNYSSDNFNPKSYTYENQGLYNIPYLDKLHTAIHEGTHTMQKFGTYKNVSTGKGFGEMLAKYEDKYGYYVPNEDTEIGRKFAAAMRTPKVGISNWYSSPNELHSELMIARQKLHQTYLDAGMDYEDAMMLVKEGSDDQLDWMIENQNLNNFFKKSTTQETKRELLRILPAAIPAAIGTGAAAVIAGSETPQYKYGGWLQKYQTAGPVKPTSNFTLPSLDPQAQQSADRNKGWEAYNAGVRTWTELLQEKEEAKGRPLTTEEKQAWLQKAVKRNDGRKTKIDPNDPKWDFLFKDSYQTWDPGFGPMTVMTKPIEVTAERTELDKELARIAAETRQAEISNPFNKSLGDTAEFSPARMKRASQNAHDQVALRILNQKPQGDRNRLEWLNTLTPQERSIIERSQYAGKLNPDYSSQFSQGFEKLLRNSTNVLANSFSPVQFVNDKPFWVNSDYTPEEAANASAWGVLAPLHYPTNLVTGALTGDFDSALQGQTSMPLFTDYRQPGFAAAMSGLYEGLYDPFNAVGIGLLKGTNIAGNAARAGKYLTEGPLKNVYNYNPLAEKLGQYNRVVGPDAIADLQTSGLVRSGQGAVTTMNGVSISRPTAFPSFGKGAPGATYIREVMERGDNPYIISTDRPMAVSTLGRHGKGSTMFPIDETGKYLRAFPASDVKVFEGKPHWFKGYKPVDTPTQLPGSSNLDTSINLSLGKFSHEIKNPGYYQKLLDSYSTNKLSNSSKKYFQGIIKSVEKQKGMASQRQYDMLQRLKQGDFNYGPKGNFNLGLFSFIKNKPIVTETGSLSSLERQALATQQDLNRANQVAANFSKSAANRKKLQEFRPGQDFSVTNQQARFIDDPEAMKLYESYRLENNPNLSIEEYLGDLRGQYGARDYGDMNDIVLVDKNQPSTSNVPSRSAYTDALHETTHSRSIRLVATDAEKQIATDAWKPMITEKAKTEAFGMPEEEAFAVQNELRIDKLKDIDGTRVYTEKDIPEIKKGLQEMIDEKHDYLTTVNVDDFDMTALLKSLNKIGLGVAVPTLIGTGAAAVIAGQDTPQQKYGGWLNKYQGGGAKEELSKFIKQPVNTNDLRYVGNQQAVTDNTKVVVPNVQAAEKQAPAIKAEIQRVNTEMKKRGVKTPEEVYAQEKAEAEMAIAMAEAANRPQGTLTADTQSDFDKAVYKAYNLVSDPMNAFGHYSKYGYIPQGNLGNYGLRDQASPMSSIVNSANPFSWLNAGIRLSNDLEQPETYTTWSGASNALMDALEMLPMVSVARPVLSGAAMLADDVARAGKYFTPKQVPNFVNNNVVNTNVWNSTLEVELDIVKQKLLDLYKNKASAEELQNVSDELTKLINIKNSDPRFKVVPRKEYSNSIKDLTRSIEPDSYNAIRFEGEPVRQGQLYDVWKDDYPNLINWKELGLKDASRSLDDFLKFRAEDYDRRDELLNYIIGPRQNKYGGSSKYQAGGDMPFDLPLRSANPGSPWAYESPQANGYLLPDVNRPQLLNTGATEYKMGVDDVTIPTVVNGQYMSPDDAYARYLLTGEQFKPMVDPHSYSAFYDTVEPLGLMKRPDGGGVFNNSINKKHNLKTSAEGYYAYINGVTLSKGGSPKSWLDKYK